MTVEVSQTRALFVSPLYVRLSDKEVGFSGRALRLRDFQRRLLDVFVDRKTKHVVLLSAPTGAGKTFSLLMPLLANLERDWLYFGSVGVYPSKELARDQMDSVSNLLLELGAKQTDLSTLYGDLGRLLEDTARSAGEYVRTFEVKVHNTSVPLVLLYITANSLKELRRTLKVASNFELLKLLWERVARRAFRIVFTVPEYPYLLATDLYQDFHRAGAWLHSVMRELYRFLRALDKGSDEEMKRWLEELGERIGRRRVFEEYYVSRDFLNRVAETYMLFRAPVFFDEFHLYSGFALASFLSLLWIYMAERGVGKVVISSATPEKPVSVRGERRDLLKLVEGLATSMGYTFIRVDAETSSEAKPGFEQVRKKLEVRLVPVVLKERVTEGAVAYGLAQRYVKELLVKSDWLEKYKEKGRSMIIVDRLAAVLEAADAVMKLTGERPMIVTSSKVLFSDTYATPLSGDLRSARLVVGNMAIAFGIDIKGMDLGLVAAKDFPSAVQKIGRFGRGGGSDTALVYLLVPHRKLVDIAKDADVNLLMSREVSHQEFLELLRRIYPRGRAEVFARTYVWVLKALLPCWVYTFATIVRLRSEMREKLAELSARDLAKEPNVIGSFASYLTALGDFLSLRNLARGLKPTVSKRVILTPVGLFNFYSFRGLATVTVKREVDDTILEENLNIATVGRNVPVEYREGEFRVLNRGQSPYAYTSLWLGASDEGVEEKLRMLDGYVMSLRAFAEIVGDLSLYQGSPSGERRRVCKLTAIDEEEELWNAPVLIIFTKKRKTKKLIEMLSAMDSAIPIYVTPDGKSARLVGCVYIL